MKPFMELTKLSVWANRRQDWLTSQGLYRMRWSVPLRSTEQVVTVLLKLLN